LENSLFQQAVSFPLYKYYTTSVRLVNSSVIIIVCTQSQLSRESGVQQHEKMRGYAMLSIVLMWTIELQYEYCRDGIWSLKRHEYNIGTVSAVHLQ